jgi:hypothetical protein
MTWKAQRAGSHAPLDDTFMGLVKAKALSCHLWSMKTGKSTVASHEH